MQQHKFFDKLQDLIKSSRSNFEHGRSFIGQKRLIEANSLIKEFLGDAL